MSDKVDLNFLKKLNKAVEPEILPGETGLEAIQRDEKKKKAAGETIMASLERMERERLDGLINRKGAAPILPGNNATPLDAPAQAPAIKEVVFYEGYKLSRDFFTAVAVCLLKMDSPEITDILKVFGFELKDMNGTLVSFEKSKKKAKRKKK